MREEKHSEAESGREDGGENRRVGGGGGEIRARKCISCSCLSRGACLYELINLRGTICREEIKSLACITRLTGRGISATRAARMNFLSRWRTFLLPLPIAGTCISRGKKGVEIDNCYRRFYGGAVFIVNIPARS